MQNSDKYFETKQALFRYISEKITKLGDYIEHIPSPETAKL
jgi:hypothetical protein